MKLRKVLSADALFRLVRAGFDQIDDPRQAEIKISLADALMSAFAMFSLKEPSLLAFDERRARDLNLKTIYQLQAIPSDTQMRTILDDVTPKAITPLFQDVFRELQRGKALEPMVFMEGYYLLSIDGTGYFSSDKIHCDSCLGKHNTKTGQRTYSHQMLGAAIVHPDFKEVIPVAPEPIIKQDGETKNDCERNAAKRFLEQFRKTHPHLPVIVVEDALSSNAPHIRELKKHDLRFILGVKEGDHPFLFQHIETARQAGLITTVEDEDKTTGIIRRFEFLNQVPLNASNPDLLVNFVDYREIHPAPKTEKHFAWLTDFFVSTDNVFQIMRGGRARWKIENETFNTLKNQGYHFEHNFGHGQKNLSVIFAQLMMLAFLVDQAQQLACPLFRAAWKKQGSKRSFWERVRGLFNELEFDAMTTLYQAILYGFKIEGFALLNSS